MSFFICIFATRIIMKQPYQSPEQFECDSILEFGILESSFIDPGVDDDWGNV